MKITKTANNKKKITISKKEWEAIGKKANWMRKKAESGTQSIILYRNKDNGIYIDEDFYIDLQSLMPQAQQFFEETEGIIQFDVSYDEPDVNYRGGVEAEGFVNENGEPIEKVYTEAKGFVNGQEYAQDFCDINPEDCISHDQNAYESHMEDKLDEMRGK